jgi:hypothetical protein
MQFSLRAMLIGILAVALFLVFPRAALRTVEVFVWCLLPVILVGWIRFGEASRRTFAWGSLVALTTATLLHDELLQLNLVLRWGLLAAAMWVSGQVMVELERRANADTSPRSPHENDLE